MKNIKGTKTERNLIEAFIGESQARNKYSYFASKARKEGYEHIAKIFEETSNNEKEHAKIWFKIINKIDSTANNLKKSIETENYEAVTMYPKFAQEAKEDGFEDISKLFTEVSEIEAEHRNRYQQLLDNIQNNQVFNDNNEVEWRCLNCGYIHKGKSAPNTCPACSHPQSFFERKPKNY